jgi:hypothetical protein
LDLISDFYYLFSIKVEMMCSGKVLIKKTLDSFVKRIVLVKIREPPIGGLKSIHQNLQNKEN